MLSRYSQSIVNHPFRVIVMTIFILTITSIGIGQLSFQSDLRIYFSKGNPQVEALDAMESTYTKADNVLFVVSPQDDVFTKDALIAIEKLTEEAWKLPFSRRVDAITNFMHSAARGDDIVVEELVTDAASLSQGDIDRIRAIALQEPLIVNRIVSPDGKVTGVNVNVNIPKGKELTSVPQVAKAARALAEKFEQDYPTIDIKLTGVVMMDTAFAEASEKDMKTLVPVMLVLVLVVVGVLMRSVVTAMVTLVVLTFSTVSAMGLAGWMGILLNPVSINAPNIILTIAVCDCVHLLTQYFSALRQGMPKQEAMVYGLTTTFKPIFLTTLSTCLGFLTLNFSDAPPFRDLGNITCLGVLMAYVFTISFLPAAMMLVSTQPRENQSESRLRDFLLAFANRMMANPKRYCIVSFGCVALACAGLFNITFNDEYVKYFDESVEFRRATDYAAEKLTGIYSIEYELSNLRGGGINDPGYLTELDAFSNWLRQRDEVLHVNSIVDVLKKVNMNMHGDLETMHTVPSSSNLSAQYLMLYEMSLPNGLDLRDRVNTNNDASRVTVTLKNLSSAEVLSFENAVQDWFSANTKTMQASQGTGLTIMFASIGQRNTVAMIKGTMLGLVFVSLLLVFAFRSIKYGLLSLLPNIFPAAIAFGLWGMLVGQVGLALSVMTAMTLGIIADDTIHFMTIYIHRRRVMNDSAINAVLYTVGHVGPALVTTSVALAVGFGILGLSSFEINAGMGVLTAIAIVIALILDIVLLPSLLLLFDADDLKVTQTLPRILDPSPSSSVIKQEEVLSAEVS